MNDRRATLDRLPQWPARVGIVLAAYAFVAGLVSFLGWALDIRRLTAWDGGRISIQPNATIAAMAAGLSLIFLIVRGRGPAMAFAALPLVIGVSTLYEHLTGIAVGVDTLIRFERGWGDFATVSPGRIGLPAAACWSLLGAGLVVAATGRGRLRTVASGLAMAALLIGSLSIVGYLFGADHLYSLPRLTAIAFQTATIVAAMAVGLIAALPEQQPVKTLRERGAAGALARRALPLVILIPLVVGWLEQRGQTEGLYDVAFGSALRTVVEAVLMTLLLWWAAVLVRRRELELRTSEEFNRGIIESSQDCVKVLDLEGRLLSMNARGIHLFRIPDIDSYLNESWVDFWSGPHRAQAEAAVAAAVRGQTAQFVGFLPDLAGEARWWRVTVSPIMGREGAPERLLAVSRDETELQTHRERLEDLLRERTAALEASHQQLRSTERMASLGTLSAGLGHDMGNLLMPMKLRLEALARETSSEEGKEDIAAIRTCAEYMQKLVNGLRLLSQDPSRTRMEEPTELRSWWADAEGVCRGVIPRGVALESSIEGGWALMSRPALTQAVFNLVQNAADALRERGAGRVVVRTENIGSEIRVSVADDGPGMSAETKARCLEPFFTTKPRGISTGLGLALVHGLVRDYAGRIEIESEPGKGTQVSLMLPATGAAPTALMAGEARRAVVDIADRRIRSMVERELRALKYELVNPAGGATDGEIFVVDDAGKIGEAPGGARGILLGERAEGVQVGSMHVIGCKPQLREIRETLRAIIAARSASEADEVGRRTV